MINPDRVSHRRIQRYGVVFFILLLCLGGPACSSNDASADRDTKAIKPDTVKSVAEMENTADTGPCALTNAEVSSVINESVTETFPQGNWGIASTCTYATSTAPAAIEVSSVRSIDLSSDRAIEGAQEVPNLGDEAVWIPATSRLTVVDKSKNKLLRIGVELPVSKDQRLEIAKAIAKLALPKL